MLKAKVQQRISDGLDRKTLRVASIWAEKCRIMGEPFPGPYRFRWTPWCKEMLDTNYEDCCGQKSAQAGFTEGMLNRAFFTLDQLKRSVLYILPASKPDASDFTQSRFNPALELSEHLSSMFSSTDNVGLKRSGECSLYIRGSRSRNQLKSLPVGLVIADEVDEMNQEALNLAYERLSGHLEKQFWKISTPSIPGYGINLYFENSTKEQFTFQCPHCSRQTQFTFPECLEITANDERDPNVRNSYYKCKECHTKITQEEKLETLVNGIWEPTESDRNIRGFQINQMYSQTVRPWEFALAFLRGQTRVEAEQEFWNSKLGQTRIVAGANLSPGDVTKCIGDYRSKSRGSGLITIGIDVGKNIHYRVQLWSKIKHPNSNEINDKFFATLLKEGSVAEFGDLTKIVQAFRPTAIVIDALPETRASSAFCSRWDGIAFKCYYNSSAKAKSLTINEDEHTVSANRTTWLDISQGRFRQGTIKLPIDISQEFKDHITAPIRIYKANKDGQDVGSYVNTKPDHLAHAGVYSEIALKVAYGLSSGTGSTGTPLA